jgi:hypothetical protein
MSGRLYLPVDGVQDTPAFRSLLARLGIDTHVTADATIALDRHGMEQLAAWFADHGDRAQANAIRRALDE